MIASRAGGRARRGRAAHSGGAGPRTRAGAAVPAGRCGGGPAGAAAGHGSCRALPRPTSYSPVRCWCSRATLRWSRARLCEGWCGSTSTGRWRPPCSPWTWTTPPATAASCATPTGRWLRIVEHRDATPAELALHEVNSSMYVLPVPEALEILRGVKSENDQQEIYLTDVIAGLRSRGAQGGGLQGGRCHAGVGSQFARGAGRGREAYDSAESVIPYMCGVATRRNGA